MTETRFRWPGGKRAAVSLTFDDARLTQPDIGIPTLDRFGVKGTFYVTPRNMADRVDAWKAAVANGHDFGNHTLTHPCSANFRWENAKVLEDMTLDDIETELLDASVQIEEMLGVTPTTFAYPCGQTFVGRGEHLKSYIPLVAKHFLVGRGAFDEIASDPAYCDLAHITSMELDRAPWETVAPLLASLTDEGRWLVTFSHEIASEGRQATPLDTLERLCAYCVDDKNGIWINTVAAVGTYVQRTRKGRPA